MLGTTPTSASTLLSAGAAGIGNSVNSSSIGGGSGSGGSGSGGGGGGGGGVSGSINIVGDKSSEQAKRNVPARTRGATNTSVDADAATLSHSPPTHDYSWFGGANDEQQDVEVDNEQCRVPLLELLSHSCIVKFDERKIQERKKICLAVK